MQVTLQAKLQFPASCLVRASTFGLKDSFAMDAGVLLLVDTNSNYATKLLSDWTNYGIKLLSDWRVPSSECTKLDCQSRCMQL